MKKFLLLLSAVALTILVPVFIVVLGIVLSQQNRISVERRVIAPKEWNVEQIAYQYAPILLQEVDQKHSNWDYITKINFDNDWDALNNSENIDRIANLEAAIYFSLLESKSHFFITYSIFHPLDWSYQNGNLKKWHENEVKNIQVVVAKKNNNSIDGSIQFITIQHGNNFDVYDVGKKSFASKKNKICLDKDIVLADSLGKIDKKGSHPVLWIEKGRHNLQPINLDDVRFVKVNNEYFIKNGIVYLPSITSKPAISEKKRYYHFLDTSQILWERNAKNPDDINSFYGSQRYQYHDDTFTIDNIPVYFNSKQMDGYQMKKENPNIVPFMLGKDQSLTFEGVLFFNPIKGYSILFHLPDWSLVYLYYPYTKLEYD